MGTRGFFPVELCKDGREAILSVLKKEGHNVVMLSPDDSPYGSVDTYEQSKKCAELFKKHAAEIEGIIVTLPNFGEERGVADTIRLANLNVPVLIQATPDDPKQLDLAHRRDSFCGACIACPACCRLRLRDGYAIAPIVKRISRNGHSPIPPGIRSQVCGLGLRGIERDEL